MVDDTSRGSGEAKLESVISYVLIIGVAASLAFEITGMIEFYLAHGSLAVSTDPAVFIRGENFFSFLGGQLSGPKAPPQGPGLRLMTIGIVLLILTPYLRALFSVLYFARRKNYKFVAITLFVFIILTASLLLH